MRRRFAGNLPEGGGGGDTEHNTGDSTSVGNSPYIQNYIKQKTQKKAALNTSP